MVPESGLMAASFKLQALEFPDQAASMGHETASRKLDKLQALGYYKIMKKKYNLLDYFICDEKDLAKRQAYVKKCEKFFKQLKVKNANKRSN